MPRTYHRIPAQDRFWSHVDKNGPTIVGMSSRCWVWVGAKDKDGYGVFTDARGRYIRAHRAGFIFQNGELGDLRALHHCDNPSCVRGSHLWKGTNADNTHDMDQKGRRGSIPLDTIRRGADSNAAKLSREAVTDIRQNYKPRKTPLRYFAEKYGVVESTVRNVVRGVCYVD